MAELRTASAGTPLEPLAAKLAAAVEKAGRENDADAQFVLSQTGGKGRLEVGSLTLRSDSGAKADLASGSRLGFSWPGGSLTLNGSMRLAGGGLPEAAIRLKRRPADGAVRSEEHTSELQSLMRISYAVFCLKKKK